VLADDSGLEVDILGESPGFTRKVFGADGYRRVQQPDASAEPGRGPEREAGAAFRCALVLYRPDSRSKSFEGSWLGEILFEPRGTMGFGYDPLFLDPCRASRQPSFRPRSRTVSATGAGHSRSSGVAGKEGS